MQKIRSVSFIALFFIFLAIPQMQGRFFKLISYPLGGYEPKVIFPVLSLNSFHQGIFQEKVAEYISQNLGLRSYFVRTDNQISVSVFAQTSPKTGAEVVIGENDVLFEAGYIKAHNKKYQYDAAQIEKTVKDLLKLQNYLRSKNKAFLLLISPSKVEIYKEMIPTGFLLADLPLDSKISVFRKYLDQYKVDYVDGPSFFFNLKKKLDFALFSNTGTHWSYYPCCLFLNEAITNIEKQITVDMPNLNCGTPNITRGPVGTDKDLLTLMNIWKPRNFFSDNRYSLSSIVENQNTKRPRALIVGTSFVWQLLKYIDRYNLFSQRDYFYYFNTNYSNRGFTPRGKIDKATIDLPRILEEKDVVILEINEVHVNEVGNGFLEETNKFIN